jgi:hypothetical protein
LRIAPRRPNRSSRRRQRSCRHVFRSGCRATSIPNARPSSIPSRRTDACRRCCGRLELGYKFLETVAYFCKCTLDGSVPSISIGRTRTDDAGRFAFASPNVHEDPFFQRYAKSVGSFFLSGTARGRFDLFDDTLRPSRFGPTALTGATPLLVTHVDPGTLSGRLGQEFLRRSGLGDDLRRYRFGITPGTDRRPLLELSALPSPSPSIDGLLSLGVRLERDGSFEQSLPPGTYDLQLRVSGDNGTTPRSILVEKDVVIRENQRTVVDRP